MVIQGQNGRLQRELTQISRVSYAAKLLCVLSPYSKGILENIHKLNHKSS